MKLSVLEQSSLSEGSSAAEAISNTVALSKELDRLGYSRIWVSEHHNLNILQGSTPEVLLAAIGAQTTRIRLGSGGVMLPNHSAYPTSVPAPEAIKDVHFGANEEAHLSRIANREIVGLPNEAKKQILERAKKYDADEVMLTMVTHKLSDKIEGFRLLAEAFGL
jgi:alkanesulfonate monooxygenase SsuD/methylene tetrahydromethanopterin reductase-like flavin-dependent oxidoreductase (luciferase family)